MWRGPVGDGANLTRTGFSDIIIFLAKIVFLPQFLVFLFLLGLFYFEVLNKM